MKKLFAVLICTLMMSAPSFADERSYEIDPVATANAPWKVGEKIVKEGHCSDADYYREFLGVTQSGSALVQDFYLSGEKFSDPFLMTVTNARANMGKACWENVEGHYTIWYKNGQKQQEANYINGKAQGVAILWYENGQKSMELNFEDVSLGDLVTTWYRNGQKSLEGRYRNNAAVGIWRFWDEEGNLTEEKDYGTPKD